MCLESNVVDWVRSLRKILTRLRGMNFCTSLACFALSVVTQPNYPKCTQIVWNAPKHEIRVEWGGSGVFVSKNSETTSLHELLHHIGSFCTKFCKATKRYQMHPDSTKCTEHEFWSQRGQSECVCCEKFWRDFVAWTFAPVRPILHWVL